VTHTKQVIIKENTAMMKGTGGEWVSGLAIQEASRKTSAGIFLNSK
jgi:hypothetical protein